MAGELNILDSHLRDELIDLPTPLAFIDFETFSSANYIIPGTRVTDAIPCQWSCHTLQHHGLDWEEPGNLTHDEFLWTGDVGWNPIYAFVQSLYAATYNANTILVYTQYERRCLEMCIQLAQNDIDKYNSQDYNDEYSIPVDYVVVALDDDDLGNPNITKNEARMKKVPLMNIAPQISYMCNEMLNKFYDLCYGHNGNGGVSYWLQSPLFMNSDSIKYVLPVAMQEYSRTSDILQHQNEPADGYAGLNRMGYIAKGDQCMSKYRYALNREPLDPVDVMNPIAAPFDHDVEYQCLLYCKLDTLAMVIIYLAVLEATDTWEKMASNEYAHFARLPDGYMHSIIVVPEREVFYSTCDTEQIRPYSFDTDIEIYTVEELNNIPIREQCLCPKCAIVNHLV